MLDGVVKAQQEMRDALDHAAAGPPQRRQITPEQLLRWSDRQAAIVGGTTDRLAGLFGAAALLSSTPTHAQHTRQSSTPPVTTTAVFEGAAHGRATGGPEASPRSIWQRLASCARQSLKIGITKRTLPRRDGARTRK